MTGYGEARHQDAQLNLQIELRALNNRYLKVSLRAADPYHLLEPEVEKVVRRHLRRGTLQVYLRCERQSTAQDFRINRVALASYIGQVQALAGEFGLGGRAEVLLGQVLALPGVVLEPGNLAFQLHDDWPVLERTLEE